MLKVLTAEHSSPQDVDRLRNEFELGRTLKGLPIVEPLALSTFQGLPALELEEFRGVPLDRLGSVPMPVEVSCASPCGWLTRWPISTREASSTRISKPHNILFNAESGEVRIADFCIASRIAREQTTSRPTRLIEGSLPYVSPEQTGRMNRSMDSRSDLYSLGVTFYELLTGHLPFEATDAIGWVHCHVARKPTAPETVRSAVPAQLSRIVLKLLAKAPDDRYQTAAGLARDLERCLQQWEATGRIAHFPLGEGDVSDRLLIPQRLYGRTAECASLQESFDRVVATGHPELLFVVGPSGSGKSSLVNELHRPIVGRRGLFVRGKFEQYKRDIPYFTLVGAFRELMLDILAESTGSIAAWQSRIGGALGSNGQLIVDLIPEVGLIIGPQPAVPELSLGDAENRLRRVLREFLAAFTTQEHSLVLFLDDLQWADAASVRLLMDVVTHPATRYLLFVGAYRNDEVGPAHPLVRALDEARADGARIRVLAVGPLAGADSTELVADTLHTGAGEVAPLAHALAEKTGGNPFFLIQLLTALHRDGAIAFDAGRGRWTWDLARVRAHPHADNVVELMLGKLRDLPPETQEALKLAACLGATLEANDLAAVFGRDPEGALGAAFEETLLLRLDDTYRFAHDRVQEAAYGLIAEDERPAVHLRIGRELLRRTAGPNLDEHIFGIVNQLNRGSALVTGRRERERIAELNLLAGQRAQKSAAHAAALRYFTAGAELLGAGAWSRRYPLAFGLQIRRAECETATGEFQAADERLSGLLSRARDVVDAAAVACLQVTLYMTIGQGPRAVDAALAYLRRAGIDWSLHPTREDVEQELARLWERLAGCHIEQLIDLPPMTDPQCRAILDVLTISSAPMSFTDENLVALAMARAVNLTLEHGTSDASPQAYVLLGQILGPYYDDYRVAFRFGKLGFDLMERKGPLRFKAVVYLLFALMVNPWRRHLRTSIELEWRAFEAAQQTGNVQFACFALNDIVTFRLASGDPLGEVERSVVEALAFVRKAKFGLVEDTLVTKLRLIRMLRGLTRGLSCFDGENCGDSVGDDFNETKFEQRLDATPSLALAACWHWIRKLQGSCIARDHRTALAAAAKAATYLWTSKSYPEITEYHFYAGLAHAAAFDEGPTEEQAEHLRAVVDHHDQVSTWGESCRRTSRTAPRCCPPSWRGSRVTRRRPRVSTRRRFARPGRTASFSRRPSLMKPPRVSTAGAVSS